MPTPLLVYSLSTDPQPLQVSTAAAITFVASNPGYSDLPALDYVDVTRIVFDFGVVGSDGADLTTSNGSTWTITPPAGWGAPAITGLQFTFTPPPGQGRIFASADLTFVFAGFTLNDKTGSPTVTITETASTPGDPVDPAYPAFPTQVAVWAQVLGKFPQHFTVGDLVASLPNVSAGAPTALALSWSGSAGAVYALGFGRQNVMAHGDGSPLLPDDFYPNPARGDTPLALPANTTFTLTVTYTPPGGGTPVSLQRQVTVDVYYPDPSVTAFTVSPAQFAPQVGPVAVVFTWSTANGMPGAPVSFSVDPPLSAAELALNATNSLFNTTHTAASSAGFTFIQGHRITLTVLGPSGTQPASRTVSLTSCATIAPLGLGMMDSGIAFTPDNTLAIIPQLAGGWRVLEVTADVPSAWPVTPISANYLLSGIAITPDGKYALSVNYGSSFGLAVLAINPALPAAQWPVTIIFITSGQNLPVGRLALSPDGSRAFVNTGAFTAAVDISPATSPESWPADIINPEASSGAVAVSPTNGYMLTASYGGITAFQFTASPPGSYTLTETLIPFQVTDIAITPDGNFALLVNADTGFAGAMLIDPGTRPDLWRITPFSGTFQSPKRIVITPDGRYAFILSADDNVPIAWVWIDATQVPSAWKVEMFGQTISGVPAIGASPDGKYAFVSSNQTIVPIAIFPPAAKALSESERGQIPARPCHAKT